MNDAYSILLVTALTIGLIHTAIGVDHSLPFVLLARSRDWSLKRTMGITFVCGLGHVLSSAIIAAVGLGLGVAAHRLLWLEETRGSLAAWLLVGFGLSYGIIALWKSRRIRGEPEEDRMNVAVDHKKLIPSLFVIFLLGPCEALLPLLTASGLTLSIWQGIVVTFVFSLATVGTMLGLVLLGYLGAGAFDVERRFAPLARHAHALAGFTIAASGACIQVFGI